MVAFTLAFHALMAYEGRQHSWLTGVYWVFTTMTTLGFGDITFTSDLGRMFSVLVMLVGTFPLLVVLRPEQQEAFAYAVPCEQHRLDLAAALAEMDEAVRGMKSLM